MAYDPDAWWDSMVEDQVHELREELEHRANELVDDTPPDKRDPGPDPEPVGLDPEAEALRREKVATDMMWEDPADWGGES